MGTTVAVGLDEVQAYIDGLHDGFFEPVKEAYKDTAFAVHKKVKDRIKNGVGDSLHTRTGALARSMQVEVHGTKLSNLGASVYSERAIASYAPTHEFGAEGADAIKAKDKYLKVEGGPYLNIPTNFNKTAAGVMRYPAREVFYMGGYIVKSSKTGKHYVMLNDEPMFTLVKQVEIPPRLKMVETAEGEIPTFLSRLKDNVQKALES